MLELLNLRAIEQEFRDEARISDVLHDLITPDGRVLTPAEWAAFQRANSPANLLTPQVWEVYPNSTYCSRYTGDPIRVRRFQALARKGFNELDQYRKSGLIRFPKETGHIGWIEMVYRSARSYATTRLRSVGGWWNRTGGLTLEEDEIWANDPDGTGYPLHPAYERLASGLFLSSAEAIRLWFDPDHDERVGDVLQESPVNITKPGRAAEFTRRPPYWDGNTLWCDGVAVMTFTDAAESCRAVLATFQEAGWPEVIDDPLSGKPGVQKQRRLGYAVEVLNSKQKVVFFYKNGTGKQVCWCWPGSIPKRFHYSQRKHRR